MLVAVVVMATAGSLLAGSAIVVQKPLNAAQVTSRSMRCCQHNPRLRAGLRSQSHPYSSDARPLDAPQPEDATNCMCQHKERLLLLQACTAL
jgi:hypothetical protein